MAIESQLDRSESRLRSLAADFVSPTALQQVAVGIVCGVVGVIFAVAYAALLFTGALAGSVAIGIGMMLFSGVILAFVAAFLTSYRPIYAQVREIPIAYLALVAPTVIAAVNGPDNVLPTVVAMVAATTIVLGASFFLVGHLGLSRFIRFIPFPVMSGFLAGVAWLIISGAATILAGRPVDLASLDSLTQPDALPKVATALVFMAAAFLVGRRFRSGLVIPALVLVAIIGFVIVVAVANISTADLEASGWLIRLPEGQRLWPPLEPAALGQVDWPAILAEAPTIAVIVPVAMIALLLNISGLEIDAKHDIDLDRELKTAGIGNLLSGLGGGAPGYQSLSMTHLSRDLGGGSRLTTLVAGLVLLAVLFLGRPLLQFVPLPIFAGVILTTGISLLNERLIRSYRQLSTGEYLILLGIFVLTVWLGFLAAVAFGTVAAMALFIFDYSRSSVVKLEVTGRDYQSNAMASDARRRLLQEHGDAILIMRLQGFLFFGTAAGLRRAIERRIAAADKKPIRFLLLDFRLVYGMDSAAVHSFVRLAENLGQTNVTIVLTHVSADVARTLRRAGLALDGGGNVRLADDMDNGLADCEREIIAGVNPDLAAAKPFPIEDQRSAFIGSPDAGAALLPLFQRTEFAAGAPIIAQGSPSDELYFLESGVAAISVVTETGDIKLATMGPGAIIGEIAFYLARPRTASVTAEGPVVAWCFTRASLAELEAKDPQAVARFHEGMAAMLADRLTTTNRLVRFLAE